MHHLATRLKQQNRRELRDEGMPQAFPGIDDEAASDPEDDVEAMEVMPPNLSDAIAMIPPLTPLLTEVQMPTEVAAPVTPDMPAPRRLPPPPSAVVSGQVSADHPSMVTTQVQQFRMMLLPLNMLEEVWMPSRWGNLQQMLPQGQAQQKSPVLSVLEFCVWMMLKCTTWMWIQLSFSTVIAWDSFNQLVLEDAGWHVESETMDASTELDTECLWRPFSALETSA